MTSSVSERHVQAIWYDAALRPQRLVTERGQEVFVVSPGDWNQGPGPDFRRAVLEIGTSRRRVVGDVEVHLTPNDWDFHGHGADPAYRNVIAHVTWSDGCAPQSLPPEAVSIWLGRFVADNPSFAPDQIDLAAYPFARLPIDGRPCERRIGHDPERAQAVLAAAGRHRLRMKARRLAGRLCARVLAIRVAEGMVSSDIGTTRRQVFYEEVMTALGYAKNAIHFRHVAERVPLADLPTESPAARMAFLVAGGFEDWNRAGLRPWNAPERRLLQAADIFTGTSMMDLCEASDFTKGSCRALVAQMRGLSRRSDACARGTACLGRGRAAAVLANVIVPFALAEERLATVPDWLPPEDISNPVRLTAFRLFGRDHNPAAFYSTNGLLIQGLLQVHRDYCLRIHPDCRSCRLGEGSECGVSTGLRKETSRPAL